AEQTAVLDYFLRTKGESLYSSDGKSVGATKEALEDWFQYWLDMQKTGAVPSADKSQSYDHNDHPSNPLVKEEAAFAWLLLGTEPEFEQDLGKPVKGLFCQNGVMKINLMIYMVLCIGRCHLILNIQRLQRN